MELKKISLCMPSTMNKKRMAAKHGNVKFQTPRIKKKLKDFQKGRNTVYPDCSSDFSPDKKIKHSVF